MSVAEAPPALPPALRDAYEKASAQVKAVAAQQLQAQPLFAQGLYGNQMGGQLSGFNVNCLAAPMGQTFSSAALGLNQS